MSLKWTSMPGFSGRQYFWSYPKQSVAILLCVFVLSSCGPVSSLFHKDENSGVQESADASTSAAGDAGPKVMAPLTGPPGMDNRPLAPGESGTAYMPNGLPALQPLGVNVDEMFSARIKDEDSRFERVENAVKDLRREFDAVKPSILRLVAVEEDMQELVTQLESLLRNEPPSSSAAAPEPVETQPVALLPPDGKAADAAQSPQQQAQPPPTAQFPPQEKAQSPPPPPELSQTAAPKAASAPAANAQVQNLRIGEHDGKTRLVFDVTGPAAYRYDIDNGEKLMIIELPGTGWTGPAQWTSGKAPLLASYTVSPSDGGGSRIIVQMKQAVSVVYETTIAGGAGDAFRIVIDLKGQ